MRVEEAKPITVCFVGNPNCGKTTLFNAFTGSRRKVANWPGVTVERVEGETSYGGRNIRVIDTPGIYSLTSYTMEERITRRCLMEEDVDVIINVVDASSLERNLYLTLQLLELKKPMVLALNMMDIVKERGMEIDLRRLMERLGRIPAVAVCARSRTGLDELMEAVVFHSQEVPRGPVLRYTPGIERKLQRMEDRLKKEYPALLSVRWYALKMLEYDGEVLKKYPVDFSSIVPENCENQISREKYDFAEAVVSDCLFQKEEKAVMTDLADRFLTHRIWGIPIFFGIMALVFFLTFTVGDVLKGYFEQLLGIISHLVLISLKGMNVAPWLVSLVVDGILAGVGGILTFLPNIFMLFLALAFLEDSGYMARVAYVMNETMGMVGLSGKAFLPMLLGFGCTVPAVMAARALESERDRRRTILITPFMSCSARLPIYVLFAELFFKESAMLTAYSLYLVGVLTAIAVAFVLHKISEEPVENALLIELPEYKMPNGRTVAIYVWEKVRDYLAKAGTTIFIASIVLWAVLNVGPGGFVNEVSLSFAARFGKVLEPVLKPAGLGSWQIAVALISGISAKEVVVSSFTVLYGIGNVNSAAGMAKLAGALSAQGFGWANAYALMVFCLLYTPCAAAIGTIRKETESLWWTLGMVLFQLVLAWSAAIVVYQAGSFIF